MFHILERSKFSQTIIVKFVPKQVMYALRVEIIFSNVHGMKNANRVFEEFEPNILYGTANKILIPYMLDNYRFLKINVLNVKTERTLLLSN